MVKEFLKKDYIIFIIPLIGFFTGWKMDRLEDERLTRYRDRSALYKRDVEPAVPSW